MNIVLVESDDPDVYYLETEDGSNRFATVKGHECARRIVDCVNHRGGMEGSLLDRKQVRLIRQNSGTFDTPGDAEDNLYAVRAMPSCMFAYIDELSGELISFWETVDVDTNALFEGQSCVKALI